MKRLLISLIEFYQKFLSFDKGVLFVFAPGGSCKFSPTCSQYSKEMVREFGVIRGSLLGLKRVWRCR